MTEHNIRLTWSKQTESFAYRDYNREHQWDFGEGLIINASSAPQFLGDAKCADPERAFAAALSSCHMLFFIAICSKKRLVVQDYVDQATAFLKQDKQGDLLISKVILRPEVTFAQDVEVDRETLEKIHQQSHEKCFLVKSVKSEIIVEPVWDIA
ncbi:MAG: OsmC family protein [Gammaproteobacteria bacterium]|nr:OsmC family protein [Gammaproteobacteria bacterium]